MVYNILARSQTLPTLQYNNNYVENSRPQETARLAFVACSSLFENLH